MEELNKVQIKKTDTAESIISVLDSIFNKENECDCLFSDAFLDLKGIEKEKLVDIFRFCMKKENLKNYIVLLNIINLIKPGNTLSPDYFKSEICYIDNVVDFMFIKVTLQKEIKEYLDKIAYYFIAILKSLHNITPNPIQTILTIPKCFSLSIKMLDLITISNILYISDDFNIKEVPLIQNANDYMSNLCKSYSIGESLVLDCFNKVEITNARDNV